MTAPRFFATLADWRAWLAEHHASKTELSVGFWKKDTGRASITWPQSVDEALAFDWIDGVRHRIDDEAYRIRFTPRKMGGIWSQVNVKRFSELKAEGRIAPAGQAAYDIGKDRTNVYFYEREAAEFTGEEAALFLENPEAWQRFQMFPAGYRKVAIHRVVSAKGAGTRAKRLNILIDASAQGLALQLHLTRMSESMNDHDSEVMDDGRIDRDDVGALGVVAAGREGADPAVVYASAGGGIGWPVLGWPAGG